MQMAGQPRQRRTSPLSSARTVEPPEAAHREAAPATERLKAALSLRMGLRRQRSARRARQTRSAELPPQECEAQSAAFAFYADAAGRLPAEDLLRCLLELGLSGSTRHERWAVDRMCSNAYFALVRETSAQEDAAAGPPGADGPTSHEAKPLASVELQQATHPGACATVGRRSIFRKTVGPAIAGALRYVAAQEQCAGRSNDLNTGMLASARGNLAELRKSPRRAQAQLPISYEDFSTEIVPAARQQLENIRQEAHFGEFLKALDKCSSDTVALTLEQVLEVVEGLNLDRDIAQSAVADMGLLTASPASSERAGESAGPLPEANFDHQVFHDVLMVVEELTERRRHKVEHEIKNLTGMPDVTFWQYRHELIKLHNRFRSYDDDDDGFLKQSEVKQLLKHIGFEPYRKGRQAALVKELLDTCDANHDGQLDLLEFIKLMENIRTMQRLQRQQRLWDVFKAYDKDGVRHLDFKFVWGMFANLGIGARPDQQDTIHRVVDEFDTDCSGEISFAEFEELTQRVTETLCSRLAEKSVDEANSLGMRMDDFAEYQWAFDQLDVDASGGLDVAEIREALQMQMGRMPTDAEVQFLYDDISVDIEGEVKMLDFLRLMKCASDHLFRTEKAFTLEDVPAKKLRECLACFPLAESYIIKLSAEELPELVANYLDVKPGTNLREVLPNVNNVRQLLEFANKKALSERTAARAKRGL